MPLKSHFAINSLLPAAHQPLQAIPRAEAQRATPPGANFPDDPVFLPPTPVFRQKTAAKPAKTASQHTGNEAFTAKTVSLAVFGPSPPPESETRRKPLPPFNSNVDYNVLFREASGEGSQAQFHASTDTWTWADAAETYNQFIDTCQNIAVVESRRQFVKNSPMIKRTIAIALKSVKYQ